MTFALASFRAYGVEAEEPVNNKYKQVLELNITGANTDVAYDVGTYAGTFWTAVGGTSPGADALLAIKDIQTRAKAFVEAGGFGGYAKGSATYPSIVKILSAASSGGSASEALTVSGLLTTDTILAVTPAVASATGRPSIVVLAGTIAGGSATPTATVTGLATSATDTILSVVQDHINANSLPLLGFNTQGAGSLVTVYSADPGGSGTIKVTVLRVATTDTYNPVSWSTQASNALTVVWGANPGAGAKVIVAVSRTIATGTYSITMNATNTLLPDILFLSGNAPTAIGVVLEWELKDGEEPVQVSG